MPSNAIIRKHIKVAYEKYCQCPMDTEQLIQYLQNQFPEDIFPKSYDGKYHYHTIVVMLTAFSNFIALDEPIDSTKSYLSMEEFEILKNSGLIFSRYATNLTNYALSNKTDCITLLHNLLNQYPDLQMTRTELESFLLRYLPKNITRMEGHELIRMRVASYFNHLNYYMILPARITDPITTKKVQIDLIGWSPLGDIVGIDVKTSIADFDNFTKNKMDTYCEYCTRLYIASGNKKVLAKARNYTDKIGIICMFENGKVIIKSEAPKRETTKNMQTYVHRIFLKQISSLILSADIKNCDTPNIAFGLLNNVLHSPMV